MVNKIPTIDSSQLTLNVKNALVSYNNIDKVHDLGLERSNIIHASIECRSKNDYKDLVNRIKRFKSLNQFELVKEAIEELLFKLNEFKDSVIKSGSLRDDDLLCVLRHLLTEFEQDFAPYASKDDLRELLVGYLELLMWEVEVLKVPDLDEQPLVNDIESYDEWLIEHGDRLAHIKE